MLFLNNMKPKKVKVSVSLDENVVVELKRLSEITDRSFSQYINMILKQYINRRNANETIKR